MRAATLLASNTRAPLALLARELDAAVLAPDVPFAELERRAIDRHEADVLWLCGLLFSIRSPAAGLRAIAAPVMRRDAQSGVPAYYALLVARRGALPHNAEGAQLAQARFAFNDRQSLSGYYAMLWHFSQTAPDHRPPFRRYVESGGHAKSLELLRSGLAEVATVRVRARDSALAATHGAAQIDSTYFDALSGNERADFVVLRTIGPLPSPPLTVRADLRDEVQNRVQHAALHLHESDSARSVLRDVSIDRFVRVDDTHYAIMRQIYALPSELERGDVDVQWLSQTETSAAALSSKRKRGEHERDALEL